MLPDEEVVDGDVCDLRLGAVWSQETQPVLGGDDVVRVGGGLSQLQDVEELLELLGGQGVDVLPHHRGFPLVTVCSGPAKLTLTTVVPCKVSYNTDSKLNISKELKDHKVTHVQSSSIRTHQCICMSG